MQNALKIVRRPIGSLARRLMGTLTQVKTQEPVAALTFDDGPHPEYTPRLLDVLERYNARATFFMVGRQALAHPQLVERVAQAGHAIGNHTHDHRQFPAISRGERYTQIRHCAAALGQHGQKLFRPPKGRQDIASRFDLLCMGYEVVTWSVQAEDWFIRESTWMADRLERQIQPGSIVLLHDAIWDPMVAGSENRLPVIEAVALLLQRIGTRFRFVTVPELMRHGQPIREHWYQEAIPEGQHSFADS